MAVRWAVNAISRLTRDHISPFPNTIIFIGVPSSLVFLSHQRTNQLEMGREQIQPIHILSGDSSDPHTVYKDIATPSSWHSISSHAMMISKFYYYWREKNYIIMNSNIFPPISIDKQGFASYYAILLENQNANLNAACEKYPYFPPYFTIFFATNMNKKNIFSIYIYFNTSSRHISSFTVRQGINDNKYYFFREKEKKQHFIRQWRKFDWCREEKSWIKFDWKVKWKLENP